MMASISIVSRLVLPVMFALGCSEGSARHPHGNSQRIVKDSGFSADPLTYTAVSRTLLTEQNYFVSYSQTSGRLGIIDADQFTEIWGTYMDPSIPFVFNLPGYEGAGFVDVGSFTVVVREGVRRFDVPGVAASSWNRARSVIAVAGYDPTGNKLHVVRFRGENLWEESAVEVFPADSGPVSGRVVVSDGGKFVVLIDAETGSYAVLADGGSAYSLRRQCAFPDAASVSGAVVDELSERAYVLSGKKVLAVDLRAESACAGPGSWDEVLIGSEAMSDIGILDNERFYATESGAEPRIHIVTRNGDDLVPSAPFTACAEPTAVNAFGDVGVVATCVNRGDGNFIEDVVLNFYSDAGAFVSASTVKFDHKAGVVFYPQKRQLFQVLDSAAGEVMVTDVTAGSTRKVGGIYFHDVLNKL